MKNQKTELHDEYAVKILSHLQEMFDGESDNHIDPKEFADEKKATAFIHALANMVPCMVYNKLTAGEETDLIGFNHIANRLCFQFGKSDKK